MDIQRLLSDSAVKMQRIDPDVIRSGNRPVSPMLILWGGSVRDRDFEDSGSFFLRFRRIWPQAFHSLINVSYQTAPDGQIHYTSLPGGRPLDVSDIRESIADTQSSTEIFTDMGTWRLYNVINTSGLRSAEEFREYYEAVRNFRKVLAYSARTMLIVLLDDSPNGHETAVEIRDFLAGTDDAYDGTVIVSNRARSNTLYRDEQIRIAAGILLLSDNAADIRGGAHPQAASLYRTDGVCLVSYQHRSLLNENLILRVYQTILDAAVKKSVIPAPEDYDWTGLLSNEKCTQMFEQTVRQWTVKIEPSMFDYLPLRNTPPGKLSKLSEMPYHTLCTHTFRGVLDHLAERYANPKSGGRDTRVLPEQMAAQWKESVLETIPLSWFRDLTDTQITSMGNELNPGNANPNESARQYFQDLVRVNVLRDILHRRLVEAVRELRHLSRESMRTLVRLRDAFGQIPSPGNMPPNYSMAVDDFLRGSEGETFVRKICLAGGDEPKILSLMLDCFCTMIDRRRDLFIQNFTTLAANIPGGGIGAYLGTRENDHFRLFGSYPVGARFLRVFLLQKTDANGDRTPLYNQLEKSFRTDIVTQYLDTGYDGELEVFSFLLCRKEDLPE